MGLQALEANVVAGHAVKNPNIAVNFPLGNSRQDQNERLIASLIAIQNLNGPGVGCPAESTTFVQRQKALGS